MRVTIRKATAHDAVMLAELNAEVQRIHAEALPWLFKAPAATTIAPDASADMLGRAGAIVLLAIADTQPIAYAYAEVRRRRETALTHAYSSLYLHHIIVRAGFRGQGIGSQLLEAIRAAAADDGITRLELDVWSFNEGAHRFFARHGFVVYNERMWTT